MNEMTGVHALVVLAVIALPFIAVAGVTWLVVHLTKSRTAPPPPPAPRGD
ncbi:hypothetical protein ACL9RL_14240 [Plantibacter sp. Mn2098]